MLTTLTLTLIIVAKTHATEQIDLSDTNTLNTEISEQTYIDSTVSTYVRESDILKLISHINHGNRIVNDMCEMMEDKGTLWSGSDKPNCRFNASFIVNSTVNMFDISENVRQFFLKRKQEACKKSEIDCGELTIILKLVDLINSIVHISLKVDNVDDIFINVEAVSFYELFQTYTETLENSELLANITLHKERANTILERERLRIKRENSMTNTESFMEYTNIYIGTPIKSGLLYVGNTVGSVVGNTLGSALSGTGEAISLSGENKLFILGIFTLLFLRR